MTDTEWYVANSAKWVLVYFADFLQLLWIFLSPWRWGYGGDKNYIFTWGGSIFSFYSIRVWGLFLCSAPGWFSQQWCVSGVRKSYFIVFPLQDNLGTTGEMGRLQKCVVTAHQHCEPCCGKVGFGSCAGHLSKFVVDMVQLLAFDLLSEICLLLCYCFSWNAKTKQTLSI